MVLSSSQLSQQGRDGNQKSNLQEARTILNWAPAMWQAQCVSIQSAWVKQ